MAEYANFKILLDDPAQTPGLGFDAYADALASIVAGSRAEFAVGIFGTWGSGKTTLMRAIERAVEGLLKDRDCDDIVTVWFTAWRYEKEAHLIVPLLDVLREELERRPAVDPSGAKSAARKAAEAVARAGLAFLAGVKLSAKTPGLEASWEPSKTIEVLQRPDEVKANEPLSFYHAAFGMLRKAISDFSADGKRRIVVFVDDLDRCLPENALDVLESMKLFFDVEGFVFVVGLDQTIAELAVVHKYAKQGTPSPGTPVSGTDYIKKIFQVPFALPRIRTDQLREYLNHISNYISLDAAFPDDQVDDFDANVRPHLAFLSGDDIVNLREVKRLINTYVLQMKMLAPRLLGALDPNVVLALQCLSFRPDWGELYDHLAADPQLFQRTFKPAPRNAEPPPTVWLSGVKVTVPSEFVDYIRGPAAPLLETPDLRSYVSAAESTHSADPSILEVQGMLGPLRQVLEHLPTRNDPSLIRDIRKRLSRMLEVAARRRTIDPELEASIKGVMMELDQIAAAGSRPNAELVDGSDVLIGAAMERIATRLGALDRRLRELRRQASIGALA